MIKTKAGLLDRLKAAGYSSYRLREDKLIGQRTIQTIREGGAVSGETLNLLCQLLDCQPGDILEYVPDEGEESK